MSKTNSIFNLAFIQKLTVFYMIIWSIAPVLSIDMIYRIAALGLTAVWFVIAFIRKISFNRLEIFAILFVLLIMVVAYIEGGFDAIMKQIAAYMLAIYFIMGVFYENHWDELSGLIPIILIILIIFNIITAKTVIADPTIARAIVRNDESVDQYIRQGVGGYGYIYGQVVSFPALLQWVLHSFKKNKIFFVIGAGWLASYIVLIMNASYSIAMATTVFCAVILLFYKFRSVVPAFIIAIVAIFGFLALLMYVEPFRDALLNYFDGTAVAKKIRDLTDMTESGETDSIQVRINAYQKSLQAIWNYPIIGYLWYGNGAGGGHSALLSYFEKYGIFGGVVYLLMVFNAPNKFKRQYYHSHTILHVTNATIVSLLFVCLLDTTPYEVMAPIMLIIPIAYSDIIRWEKIEKG